MPGALLPVFFVRTETLGMSTMRGVSLCGLRLRVHGLRGGGQALGGERRHGLGGTGEEIQDPQAVMRGDPVDVVECPTLASAQLPREPMAGPCVPDPHPHAAAR